MIVENNSQKQRFYIAAFLIALLSLMVLTDKAFSAKSETSKGTEMNKAPTSTLDESEIEIEVEDEDESDPETTEDDSSIFDGE